VPTVEAGASLRHFVPTLFPFQNVKFLIKRGKIVSIATAETIEIQGTRS
jgi:hypothetical protein